MLIWGGAGGLGSMAIQIVKAAGGNPVAVVSDDDKVEYCKKLGAVGVHQPQALQPLGHAARIGQDEEAYNDGSSGARAFGKAFWDALGEKPQPAIVFEHPGEATVPTSIFVCDTGGMVVICAGTTGYNATWTCATCGCARSASRARTSPTTSRPRALNDLVLAGKVDPCLSPVFEFDETGACHQLMHENKHPNGNMAILVNAKTKGLKTLG